MRGLNKTLQDKVAFLHLMRSYMRRDEDQQFLPVSMKNKVKDRASDLFAGSRLYFHSHRRTYRCVNARRTAAIVRDYRRPACSAAAPRSGFKHTLTILIVNLSHG